MPTPKPARAAQKARALLMESQADFANGGDHLKACQKLWQAAAHAITAVARQRGWAHGDLPSLRLAVNRLSEELDDEMLFLQFDVADTFRVNAEYGFMEDFQLEGDRQDVRLFIERVLSLPEMPPNGDAGR